MKKSYLGIITIVAFSIVSCEKAFFEPEESGDVETVFETFWTIVDENYCFFEEKNVDWDELYALNRSKISNESTNEIELFKVLADMLAELRDGHVRLYQERGRSRYNYEEGYASNFNWNLLSSNYLKDNYKEEGYFRSALIDSILYLNISDFDDFLSDGKNTLNPTTIKGQFDDLIAMYPNARGLIIDVRDNGGGNFSNGNAILSRLIKESTIAWYSRAKNGPGHSDFGEAIPVYVEPRAPYYEKQVVVLTNRSSYSATNYFASIMKLIPENVIVVGGKSGGGSGLPSHKDLPNGWVIRLSTSQVLSSDMEHIEDGIEPDIAVDMKEEDILNGEDTILETALALID